MRRGGRKVQPGSLSSLEFTLRVLGFIRCCWFHGSSPWGLSCTSRVCGFTRVRPGSFRVHSATLGSLGCALGVVGFIRDRWVHCSAPLVVGFIRGRCVNCVVPWGTSDSSGAAVFTGVRSVVRPVHPWSLGSLACCHVHPGLLGSLGCALRVHPAVAEFTGGSSGSSWVPWFNVVRHGWRPIHQGSLGSLGCTLQVVGFIRVFWVHWGATWASSDSSRVAGFAGVCPGVCRVHLGSLDSLECALGVVGLIRG